MRSRGPREEDAPAGPTTPRADGRCDPNTAPICADALSSLYPLACKLKLISRRELGSDDVVPPLEGLWWAEDMDAFIVSRDRSRWEWTMMLMVPSWIELASFLRAVHQAGAKNSPACLDEVLLETLSEGRCVQTLHLGSFDDEGLILERTHGEFIPMNGLRVDGKHHEICFSDSRS